MEPGRLANIDLNLLKALDALLREQSVTRAAARLMITQPSMSGSLARLRAVLDDEILVRTGRSMRPTPLAERLEAPVRDILERIEQTLVARTDFDPARHERTFTVLATDYPVLVLLRPFLAALRHEAPGVHVRIETARPEVMQSRRALEGVDLAIVPAPAAEASSLPCRPIFSDRFVGAAWRENGEVTDTLTFETLHRLPYVSFRQAGRTVMTDQSLEDLGHHLDASTVVESFVVGALLLEGTMQVAFLPEQLIRRLEDRACLRALRPPVEFPLITEAMVWPRHADGDPAHCWLRDRVAELAAGLRSTA